MDIYVLDMSGAEFATLLDRGYAVELGGSEKIASLVGQMYPAIAEAASRDGMVYALPLEMYNYKMCIRDSLSSVRWIFFCGLGRAKEAGTRRRKSPNSQKRT